MNWQRALLGWWILNASYKWQMGNRIFVFVHLMFSLMSSAACSPIGDLLTALPSLFAFMQLWEQVSASEQAGIPVRFGLPHIPQLSSTLQGFFFKAAAVLTRSRHALVFFLF